MMTESSVGNKSISLDLQNYLSQSSAVSSMDNLKTTVTDKISWFSKSAQSGLRMSAGESGEPLLSSESSNESAQNGWFSEAQKDPCLPSLTRKQRILGFVFCVFMGLFCFSLASLYIPFLLLKARKFSLLYTLGSVFLLASFSLLWGPVHHMKHLFSKDRLPFTTVYLLSMVGTLYCALHLQSTLFTVIFAIIQILALVWYIVSYIPGGQTGLKFFQKIFSTFLSRTVKGSLPI